MVERPASVVKELIENAIDAGASRIEVATMGGGRLMLRVTDDGCGIAAEELLLALERHATSKLDHDLMDVRTLGFRGEALPSIGSVARLTLTSRTRDGQGHAIRMEAGAIEGPEPAPGNLGTVVEVRDLFFATPARLKFLRSERAEGTAITDVVRHAALAHPTLRFALTGPDRRSNEWAASHDYDPVEALRRRIAQVLGEEVALDMVPVEGEREGVLLTGFTGLPTANRNTTSHQFMFVNGRPVRDKQLLGALRGAYGDLVPKGRHAAAVLFIDAPPGTVDVNVHPQKAEVRFRDPGNVRALIVGTVRDALAYSGRTRASHGLARGLAEAFGRTNEDSGRAPPPTPSPGHAARPERSISDHEAISANGFGEAAQSPFALPTTPAAVEPPSPRRELNDRFTPSARAEPFDPSATHHPLGAARAQLHECYIVAQTDDGIVLIDQHAAHERLVFEALKASLYGRAVPAQMLLVPDIVALSEADADRLEQVADDLVSLGLEIERFGADAIAVRATPAMLGTVDAKALLQDLVDEIGEWGTSDTLRQRIDHVAATIACHGSIRSGRRMSVPEMDALLRRIEATPGAEQCNHGRPTFVRLALKDVERLFGR